MALSAAFFVNAAILVLAVTGGAMCAVWATLIVSFGQLNTGKFAIINEMEKELTASDS